MTLIKFLEQAFIYTENCIIIMNVIVYRYYTYKEISLGFNLFQIRPYSISNFLQITKELLHR